MQCFGSVSGLVGRYKVISRASFMSGESVQGVLLDQFGVLHDGRRAYPGAVAALEELHRRKLAVYVLSNSSQRSRSVYGRLASLGFRQEWMTEIVTSGEMTHRYLLNRRGHFWETLGKRCMHFTWNARGKIDLTELDLQIVTERSEVEFVLVHGVDAIGMEDGQTVPQSLEELLARLDALSKLETLPPMIVANPDLVTVDGSSLTTMPGTLGLHYRKLGGEVVWMGKPGRIIYDNTLESARLLPDEVVAIGDSMEHDIRGAREMDIPCVFVCSGIHSGEVCEQGQVSPTALQKLYEKHGLWPDAYMESFRL